MIISVLNTKGGVGKSTVSINLAVAWAQEGYETLLIDTDEEGTSVAWYSRREEQTHDRLTVISLLAPEALKKSIRGLVEKYDVIVIDGAPHLRQMLIASAWISDMVLIPVKPSPNDIWKLGPMVERLQDVKATKEEMGGQGPEVRFIINEDVGRARLSREVRDALEMFELPVLESRLASRMDYRDAFNQGLAALEFSNPKAKTEMSALFGEVKTHLGVAQP